MCLPSVYFIYKFYFRKSFQMWSISHVHNIFLLLFGKKTYQVYKKKTWLPAQKCSVTFKPKKLNVKLSIIKCAFYIELYNKDGNF